MTYLFTINSHFPTQGSGNVMEEMLQWETNIQQWSPEWREGGESHHCLSHGAYHHGVTQVSIVGKYHSRRVTNSEGLHTDLA